MATLRDNLLVCETLESRVGKLLTGIFGEVLGGRTVKAHGKNVFMFEGACVGHTRVFWRWRNSRSYDPNVFTMRSVHRRRTASELSEILTGAFDYYLYVCLDRQEEVIEDWFLIDLRVFRYEVNSNFEKFIRNEQRNEDRFGRWGRNVLLRIQNLRLLPNDLHQAS